MLIDCHAHLTDAAFQGDLAAVLERARAAGVGRILVVGQDSGENEAVLALSREQPLLAPCLGLHADRFADRRPEFDPQEIERVVAAIRAEAAHIAAIGEVGLDRWVCQDEGRRGAQREAFSRLVDLALELDLPLNVHSRSAGHHTVDLLIGKGARRVLMHAFDGKPGHALRGAEAGFLFSIPPSIVRSPQKQKLVKALPLSALALETDSPVLGVVREQRNEPSQVVVSLRAIAEIKGLSEVEVARQTTENAQRLFRLEA
jgi:TatD DNase family protein